MPVSSWHLLEEVWPFANMPTRNTVFGFCTGKTFLTSGVTNHDVTISQRLQCVVLVKLDTWLTYLLPHPPKYILTCGTHWGMFIKLKVLTEFLLFCLASTLFFIKENQQWPLLAQSTEPCKKWVDFYFPCESVNLSLCVHAYTHTHDKSPSADSR